MPLVLAAYSSKKRLLAQIMSNQDNSSIERSAPRHIFLPPSATGAESSPSRRAISFSHWTRYSTTPINTPPGQLKASLLCKASGTSASYDPPLSEWTYLGADQPVKLQEAGPRMAWREWGRQKAPRSSSPLSQSMVSSSGDEDSIKFRKQNVKQPCTVSQLTMSTKEASTSDHGMAVSTTKKYGLEGLSCADLPCAFDSDDEDE
jgi:hypothetical protein